MDWNAILTNVVNVCIDVAFKLLLSAVVFFVGRFNIRLIYNCIFHCCVECYFLCLYYKDRCIR